MAGLCERSFLKLWSYPNPFKEDGKELCDLVVVFENDILVFFDRESLTLKTAKADFLTQWKRWEKEVITKQVSTARGAEKYIRNSRPIFLDQLCTIPLPIPISPTARIHKIVVAHGAKESCRQYSPDNVSGSLAISYAPQEFGASDQPFFIHLDRAELVNVFDSENLEIILSELDTISDFVDYLLAKRDGILRHKVLSYCGEEDLLAHYLMNYDKKSRSHKIGSTGDFDLVHIGEGEWEGFKTSGPYKRRKDADRTSYVWDQLIQKTAENALNGSLIGNGDPFTGRSAIHFMAKEPRYFRRALSDKISSSIRNFPESDAPIVRSISLMPSSQEGTSYVFLQLKVLDRGDYDTEYRPRRTAMLEIACGVAKVKWPAIKRVIGIAIDAPKYSELNSEDLLLREFDDWTEEDVTHFKSINEQFRFFENGIESKLRISEFPPAKPQVQSRVKTGRNQLCPCGSGKKHKRCCINS